MNCSPFKYHVSHMCLTCSVVASWFVTQEVAGSNPFTLMTNIFAIEFAFSEKLKCF